jgi:hypothetical protein
MPIDLKQSFLMMPYGICTDYPIDALEVRNHLLNNNLIKDGKI